MGMRFDVGGCMGVQVAQLAGAPPPPREVIVEVPVKQGYVVTNPDGCALVHQLLSTPQQRVKRKVVLSPVMLPMCSSMERSGHGKGRACCLHLPVVHLLNGFCDLISYNVQCISSVTCRGMEVAYVPDTPRLRHSTDKQQAQASAGASAAGAPHQAAVTGTAPRSAEGPAPPRVPEQVPGLAGDGRQTPQTLSSPSSPSARTAM